MPKKDFGSPERLDEWSRKIHHIMDEMQTRIFVEYRASATWQPRVNLYACREALYLCVELTGLDEQGVCVDRVTDTRIRLTGHRKRPHSQHLQTPLSVEMMEIDEGPFFRELELPEPVDAAALEIRYDRGHLWITLPKIRTS
jgi:HSP20 family molecular chaperone IbpA